MTPEQETLVKEIQSIEKKIKKLMDKINKSVIEANELKLQVVNLRDVLRDLYLKLKEVTEAQKPLDSIQD
jgi:uncharacterized coiled-coil DUF342 family protein